jgi:hypothetical protein
MSPTSCRRRRSLDERGLTEYLISQLGDVNSTWHDASTTLGHHVEIHGERELARLLRGSAADGWDGSEPLRAAVER